ncbi:acyl transferase/acyl hydrolase/lysophospholipase [Aspergillus undulatus]|uniref:acyl transferase/acyl hydrolase/lysophospholipase n=1 Tax=Aspergillus undulatus TaxID=1810928 RepID=UPI003CCCF49E
MNEQAPNPYGAGPFVHSASSGPALAGSAGALASYLRTHPDTDLDRLAPLRTAPQVALVDILRAAGVESSAVVGHSSGEIGAEYSAGYLNAIDAIRVAYYRVVHSHLAQGPGGKRGKMMAVGTCPATGKWYLLPNVLQVDTAYHSHHMLPCGTPYPESMKQCGIKVQKGRKQCRWYSSVWGSNGRSQSFNLADGLLLKDQYWVDNMTQAVLFSQALSRALNEDQFFDLALEVGPHLDLKEPSAETIKMLTGLSLPYSGVLKGGQSATESFADALGLLWSSFPSSQPMTTFDGLRRAFPSIGKPQKLTILKGLPAYSWDHPSLIWKEPRSARIFRAQAQPRHEHLGHSVTHGERDKREVHWKQVLRLNELPWLAGHRIQGEVLFPASGYLSMAYEAAPRLVDVQQPLRLVELHDIGIVREMRLEEDSSGLEVVFTIGVTSHADDCIAAEVSCYSGAVDSAQPLDAPQPGLAAHFTGKIRPWLG